MIHGHLQAEGFFHKAAISRGLFFPAVLFFFIQIQCQSCFGSARHLKDITELLFTAETNVAVCGLSQHLLFRGGSWLSTVTKQTSRQYQNTLTQKPPKYTKPLEPLFQELILFCVKGADVALRKVFSRYPQPKDIFIREHSTK